MSSQNPSRPVSRPPLGEATRRVNNAQYRQTSDRTKRRASLPHHESLRPDGLLQVQNAHPTALQEDVYAHPTSNARSTSPSNAVNPRLSAISKGTDSNRNSQISTVSTNASDGKKIKGLIGPWQLGITLGKGATARVRKGRHKFTGQDAAIKIVQKSNAKLSQAGSLAALDASESRTQDKGDGLRRMPIGIEREVAIMKLIQHPHILKLYDIWENRYEIYLILEYVDNGELFERITANGRLVEEEAIKYFRQMISAIGYCHSFKICHRDLKPENILLTSEGSIRIADFGMAALHQGPDHKLDTACGSPHYAAPELIGGKRYRGEKVDIWSMGVILFATLAGRLPFDVEGGRDWLATLLKRIRKGEYEMAEEFSLEAKSLIWRMLQTNPRDRVDMQQIWKHPLLRKYDYLDDYGAGYDIQCLSPRSARPVFRKSDIDKELLRQLRSMWHKLSEDALIKAILNDESNDQKLFYGLLVKFRDEQLENYVPDLDYSTSDYHHVRPKGLTKTYSTCQFQQPHPRGHGRQTSRFTVISNTAETEQSYDPFKASRPQHLDAIRPEHAKITIHRTQPSDEFTEFKPIPKGTSSSRPPTRNPHMSIVTSGHSVRGRPSCRVGVSRDSMASSSRSRNSANQIRVPGRYKRNVSFSYIRDRSLSSHGQGSAPNSQLDLPARGSNHRHSNHTEVTDDGGHALRPVEHATPRDARYIRSKKGQGTPARGGGSKGARASLLWHEDVRQLSSDLAKDCDLAFNGSSMTSADEASPIDRSVSVLKSKKKRHSLTTRPLPPPPERSDSIRDELIEAQKHAQLRKKYGGDSPRYLDRMVSHIDRLIQPTSPVNTRPHNRRIVSAPGDSAQNNVGRPLPSINERRGEEGSPKDSKDVKRSNKYQVYEANSVRTASAPEPRDMYATPRARNTIRVVDASSPFSPVKMPAPLTIRKKASSGGQAGIQTAASYAQNPRQRPSGPDMRGQYQSGYHGDGGAELGRIDEDGHKDDENSNTGTILRNKPSSWFKRSSKSGEDINNSNSTTSGETARLSALEAEAAPATLPTTKKKGIIGRLFSKKPAKPDIDMSLSSGDIFEDEYPDSASAFTQLGFSDAQNRQIQPQQNWLAKLFRVKPACKYICFQVRKRRARVEITTLLKEWRRYGIRDIHVDRERNIVFGKVGVKNFLDMKEVSFAAEIMTVIEHGKESHLSIARITQERGAASSFHKVIETLESVCQCRGLLVTDEQKRKMMIKTLISAS